MRSKLLAFAAGVILLQFQGQLPAGAPWGLAALLLVPAPALWPGRLLLRGLAVLAFLVAGFGWAAWRAELRLAEELPLAWEGRDVAVVGVVAGLPQAFGQGSRFEFDVESSAAVGGPGGAEPAPPVPGHIMLSWYQGRRDGDALAELPPLRPGERWRLTVRLKRPHGNANPQAFDYEAWLLERNIRATGYVRAAPDGAPVTALVASPGYGSERLRHRIRESFLALLPPERYPLAGILVALAVGDQRAIHGDLWNTFNRTGTTHLMSISGLHVTMVAALVAALVNWGWRRAPRLVLACPAQRVAVLAGWAAAFFYTALAGFGVPAQRTLYMLSVAALALQAGRLVAPSRILALALLVVLLIDPWAVLAAGFWLSFGAVASLLYIGAPSVGRAPGWRGRLREWGLVQWAATLASLPIVLLIFQQFSLVSPLANAVAIPVVSFLVTPLALLGAVVPWWPILELAHGLLAGLMAVLDHCAAWPVWQAPAPPLWAALLAAPGVAVLLLPRGVPGRPLGAFLLLPVLFWPAPRPAPGEAWITVLDVGQGLATLVQTAEHSLVYDPGPLYSAESDAGQRVVVPYLRTLGLNRLDLLLVTHRDSDHAGGAASLRAALPVDGLRTSIDGFGGEPCLAGQAWTWDGVRFTILHPGAEGYRRAGKSNNLSCVLRVEAGGRAMLLTSDIEAVDEAALLARDRAALAAEVLLVPHHGSRTSSTPDFLAAVGAREAIVPVGYRNRFGHPKAEVLERYAAGATHLWRTDRDGAIRVRLGGDGVALDAWRQEHPRYWHGR